MGRYECKRHLLYLLCGAVVGMILYFMWDESFFQQINQSLMETGYHLSDTDVEMAYHFRWLLGAVMIASVVNGVLILRYAMIKFNLSGVFLLVLFPLLSNFLDYNLLPDMYIFFLILPIHLY